ncbi:DUF2612 domain-containing protein [Atlantibacter hermannii]|uniref:DUF2612 domain-containing protein n=1 Tax=Atlantibacter hermannii TaxID=565 RepID=UPI0030764BF6
MSKYTELITNYHATRQLFPQHVDLITRPLTDAYVATGGLIDAFDLDNAVGVQLDILGEWIGRSRQVSTPISGVYFSWDDSNLGWDRGNWQGPFDPDEGLMQLSDDTYRVVLKAKAAINQWNGRNESIPDILDVALAGSGIRMAIIDNLDMTESVWVMADPNYILNPTDRMIVDSAINGGPFINLPADYSPSQYLSNPVNDLSNEMVWVIKNGYLTIKPGGVRIREIITPSSGYQFFGFDIDDEYVSGFDQGAWESSF